MLTRREGPIVLAAAALLVAAALLGLQHGPVRIVSAGNAAADTARRPDLSGRNAGVVAPSATPGLPPAVLERQSGPPVVPPPMGWNGYNHFHLGVTAAIVEAEARALVRSGMKSAGYDYVNLDGGWDLPARAPDGSLQADPAKFPSGIAPVAAYVHSLGLKFGIYTSAGLENCAHSSAGSYGHYQHDAATFAAWGVDFLKLDWCVIPYAEFPGQTHRQVSMMLAREMEVALHDTGRPILLDVNDWARSSSTGWARGLATMWRVAPDIQDTYRSLVGNFIRDADLAGTARPGGWNDPDMLEVGNGAMSTAAYQAQMSLWAELAAPLIAGNDLTQMTPETQAILTNAAVIRVDRDPLGVQGSPVSVRDGHWVLTKPLADGSRAVVLFNATALTATITSTTADVGLRAPATYRLQDLWTGATSLTHGPITAVVPPYGAVMFRIS